MKRCPHKKESGRSRCRECRRAPGSPPRPSRLTAEGRPRRKRRVSVFACLSEAEWRRLWQVQAGRCGICHDPLRNRYAPGESDADSKIANLDHDHRREKELLAEGYDARDALRGSVRGLLCYQCNRNILHAVRDSATRAFAAGNYLLVPPCRFLFVTPMKEAA